MPPVSPLNRLDLSWVPRGRKCVVAVSGGADSTALLRLLVSHPAFGPSRLVAAHVNYRLRGAASDRDEAFVRSLCLSLGVRARVLKVRRPPPRSRSLQDWARETRYDFFARVRREEKAWGVATAHHLDDQAETVLDRLLRGAGLRGLGALRPVYRLSLPEGDLRVWRPLLPFRRAELEAFLRSLGQGWRTDASNRGRDYRRNRIRHDLLPLLRTFNPRVEEVLARLAETVSAEDVLLDALAIEATSPLRVRRGKSGLRWEAEVFAHLDVALQRRVLRRLMEGLKSEARGLRFDRLEEARRVLGGTCPGPRDLGMGLVVCREGSSACLRQAIPPPRRGDRGPEGGYNGRLQVVGALRTRGRRPDRRGRPDRKERK